MDIVHSAGLHDGVFLYLSGGYFRYKFKYNIGLPQLAWTVLTQNGQRYQLGLYHGDTSRHVLIHANGKILLTDFSVEESRTYSFYLEDDLCEVVIERQKDGFGYSCRLNKEADTELNRERKKLERKHWRQTLLWVGGILLTVIFISVMATRQPSGSRLEEEMLLLRWRQGRETSVVLSLDAAQRSWQYTYRSYFKTHTGSLSWPLDTVTPAGWPLESGDEFKLYHSSDYAHLFFVDLAQPDTSTQAKYRTRAEEVHFALHPEHKQQRIKCEVAVAEAWLGNKGLWLLYSQRIYGLDYQALVLTQEFEQAVADCLP